MKQSSNYLSYAWDYQPDKWVINGVLEDGRTERIVTIFNPQNDNPEIKIYPPMLSYKILDIIDFMVEFAIKRKDSILAKNQVKTKQKTGK